jgi:hypothetical protein
MRQPIRERVLTNFTRLRLNNFIAVIDEKFTEDQLRDLIGMSSHRFVMLKKKSVLCFLPFLLISLHESFF